MSDLPTCSLGRQDTERKQIGSHRICMPCLTARCSLLWSLKQGENTAALIGVLGTELEVKERLVGPGQTGRAQADFGLEDQQEQRLKILPKLFMGFLLYSYLSLLVSIKHRWPGSPSIQRTRTGPGLWFSLLFIPLDCSTLGHSEVFSSRCLTKEASHCSE